MTTSPSTLYEWLIPSYTIFFGWKIVGSLVCPNHVKGVMGFMFDLKARGIFHLFLCSLVLYYSDVFNSNFHNDNYSVTLISYFLNGTLCLTAVFMIILGIFSDN